MSEFSGLGKVLIGLGVILFTVGVFLTVLPKFVAGNGILSWLGRLPGDFSFKKDNVTVYFPFATSLVISLVLTIVSYLVLKGKG